MKFKLPTDFVLPDGVEPGQEFDAVVTLNLADDGSGVTVVALDGSLIADAEEVDDEDDDDAPPVPSEADFLDAVTAEMAV